MARVAFKAVCEGKPLAGAQVSVSVQVYDVSWIGVTGWDGQVFFEVPVGGMEAGRWAEPGDKAGSEIALAL